MRSTTLQYAYSLIVYVVVRMNTNCISFVNAQKFAIRPNHKLKENCVLIRTEGVSGQTLMQCAISCVRMPGCLSASWRRPHCLLTDWDTITSYEMFDSCLEKGAEGWTAMSVMRFSVSVFGVPQARYTLTYEQGAQLCTDLNTTMATDDDMLAARRQGLDVCNCGWIVGGYSGFILQRANPICYSSFSHGVIPCVDHTTSDVWCVMQ